MSSGIVLGSRGSALALAQVALVEAELRRTNPALTIEIKIISTSGDRRQDVPAGEGGPAGLKGLFTKEIQDALLYGKIDVAVHSLKDLPGITPDALELAAVLPRANPFDLLISSRHRNLESLPSGARVGTGSVRRRRQLLWMRPDLEIVEIRGNVPTRIRKMLDLGLDAIVLACAGLDRLGFKIANIDEGKLVSHEHFFVEPLHAAPLDILPAIGQGAIGLEIRRSDKSTHTLLSTIDDRHTHLCVKVERDLLRQLDGDCHLPVAAHATLDEAAGLLHARALVFPPEDSAPPIEASASGFSDSPESLATELFRQLTVLSPLSSL